jgi:multimeric flavodoxin WrbA
MKVCMISDKDFRTEAYERINRLLRDFFTGKGYELKETAIGREDLAFCIGCFGCWVKKPGECVINDAIGGINREEMNSDAVIFLSPVVFGQFSANIKNAVDRWLPNMLPFFVTRADGSTMHPPRYPDYPKQVIIGYGDQVCGEDERLFTDITKKHRSNLDVLIWRDNDSELAEALGKIEFKRLGGSL